MGEKVKGNTIAEDVIWWKIDENHHQWVIISSSEESAKAELEQRVAKRANDSEESGIILLEEHMGPVMSQLSMLKLAYLIGPCGVGLGGPAWLLPTVPAKPSAPDPILPPLSDKVLNTRSPVSNSLCLYWLLRHSWTVIYAGCNNWIFYVFLLYITAFLKQDHHIRFGGVFIWWSRRFLY